MTFQHDNMLFCTATPNITSVSASPVIIPAPSLLTLRCESSGPPGTALNWYHDGNRLDPDSDSNVVIQQDGTLVVTNTTIGQTGTYTCNVSTSFTFVLSQFQVIIGGNWYSARLHALPPTASSMIHWRVYITHLQGRRNQGEKPPP